MSTVFCSGNRSDTIQSVPENKHTKYRVSEESKSTRKIHSKQNFIIPESILRLLNVDFKCLFVIALRNN